MPQKDGISTETASELFFLHYRYVQGVAFRYAPLPSLQGDIVHDVFLRFVENAGRWVIDESKVRALLHQITRRVAFEYWREHKNGLPSTLKKIARHIETEMLSKERDSFYLDSSELELALDTCLQKLSPKNRRLIEMHYYERLSYSDLCVQTGYSLDTLYSLLSQIRSALRRCIERALKVTVDDVK